MRVLRNLSLAALLLLTLMHSPGRTRAQAGASNDVNELLATIADGLGGPERLLSLNALRFQLNCSLNYSGGRITAPFDTVVAWPDRLHEDQRSQDNHVYSRVISPTVALCYDGLGRQYDCSAEEKRGMLEQHVKSQVPFVIQHANDPGVSFSLAGTETVAGVAARVLKVNVDGSQMTWYVDPGSGRVLRMTRVLSDGSTWVRDYSDWRSVDGLVIPFRWREVIGETTTSYKVTAVEINPQLDPAWFSKLTTSLGPMTPGQVGPARKVEARLVPRTASLQLQMQPGAVQVYVDDIFKGMTSAEGRLVVEGLVSGTHRVRMNLIGYTESARTVELKPGETATIEAKLEPAGPKPLALAEIEEALTNGLPPKGITKLVNQYGVDFALTKPIEQRLRDKGADSDLLVAIATNKK